MSLRVYASIKVYICPSLSLIPVESCTFPAEWDGLWYDSRNTEVTLDQATSAVLSGWSVTAYTSTVTSWTCVEQSEDTYLLK